ncbi:MAG: hypothetical protein HFJ38_02600 [Bacilli bacterium]|nr:hypothetical protein [Bacilli bacterium]
MSKKHNRGIYSSNKNQKYKDLSQDIQTLTVSYTFLMSTLIIFLLSLESFRLELFGNSVSLAIFFMPFVYFLVDVILKEIGLKPAIKAIVTSIFVLFLFSLVTDYLFHVEFSLFRYIGLMLSYSISQFLNTSVYYYMLSNYRTPLFLVLFNLVFALLVNNMIYMFFTSNMIFTTHFWSTYIIIICIQTLVSMILTLILNLIEQGLEL